MISNRKMIFLRILICYSAVLKMLRTLIFITIGAFFDLIFLQIIMPFLPIHITCINDIFFKNCSVNIKIPHLISKSLIFVLCQGSGCQLFLNQLNQYQFGFKRLSTDRLSYLSNSKCNFGVELKINDLFSKISQLTLKLLS